jgi:hypothetical protein
MVLGHVREGLLWSALGGHALAALALSVHDIQNTAEEHRRLVARQATRAEKGAVRETDAYPVLFQLGKRLALPVRGRRRLGVHQRAAEEQEQKNRQY